MINVVFLAGHHHGDVTEPGCSRILNGSGYTEAELTGRLAARCSQKLNERLQVAATANCISFSLPSQSMHGKLPYSAEMYQFVREHSQSKLIVFIHLHIDASNHHSRLFMHDYRSRFGKSFCELAATSHVESPIVSTRIVETMPSSMLGSGDLWKSRAYNCICSAYQYSNAFAVLIEAFNINDDACLAYFTDSGCDKLADELVDAVAVWLDSISAT